MGTYANIELNKLMIWSDNPRHFTEGIDVNEYDENEIINILIDVVGTDKMFNLMADIVSSNGLMGNILPVVVQKDNKYLVYDGNRRVSSLKLLNNPNIAEDDSLKTKNKKLVKDCDLSFSNKLNVYVTDEENALELMDKIHNGEQEGVGLIPWEAFQRDYSLVKRGKKAKYTFAYQVSSIMGFSKKAHFKIPYTDLDRLFSSPKLQVCFGIIDFTNEYKNNIKYAIDSLIKYKQQKGFRSFSRHFNKTNSSEPDAPIIEFCSWVEKEKKNRDKLFFELIPVELFEKQNYNFSDHNLVILDANHVPIVYSLDDLNISYKDPNGEETKNIDTSEIGTWEVIIKYKNQGCNEHINVKKLCDPKIDFNNSKLNVKYGNTLNLREQILRAKNGYDEDVTENVEIAPLTDAQIVGDVFDSSNPIGEYSIKYSFQNVNGEPFSVVKNINVTDNQTPITARYTSAPLLSFNGNSAVINISPEVNELVREINSLDFVNYCSVLIISLRAVIELTFDQLKANSIGNISGTNDFTKKWEEFKHFLLNSGLSTLCTNNSNVLSSFHSEQNTVNLWEPEKISAYLNLAAHKGAQRIDETKAVGYCKSTISPFLVYASLLLN